MIEEIRGKKVLVLGLARSGRAAARLLLRAQASRVVLNDCKEAQLLQEEVTAFKGDERVEIIAGGHPESLLEGVALIIKSPGINPKLPLLQEASRRDIPVYSEIELAYHFSAARILGITGTNGKTTTVSLVGEMFRQQYSGVFMAGNIGYPLSEAVQEAKKGDIIIAELSSFQLENIKDFRSPIAAILNITPDHLDYHGSMEQYIAAKGNILLNQQKEDVAVLNWDDSEVRKLLPSVQGKHIFFSRKEHLSPGVYLAGDKIVINWEGQKEEICSCRELKIPGLHNLENALAAVAFAFVGGVKIENIVYALRHFQGVSHRLELVAVINGVTFINDSKGTNPDAALMALQSFPGSKILLAGGLNKGGDYLPLVKALKREKVKKLVLLGEAAPLILNLALGEGFTEAVVVSSLQEAVLKAYKSSCPGDVVLLSPACASWDMFKNYEERGEVFKSAVFALKEGLCGEKSPHGA